jgi:hypothetical protein
VKKALKLEARSAVKRTTAPLRDDKQLKRNFCAAVQLSAGYGIGNKSTAECEKPLKLRPCPAVKGCMTAEKKGQRMTCKVAIRYVCTACRYRWVRDVNASSPQIMTRPIGTPDCPACRPAPRGECRTR